MSKEIIKQEYFIGCHGYTNLKRIKNFNEKIARARIREHIAELCEKYDVTLYSELADGADLIFAEEALKVGAKLIAVLPKFLKTYKEEHEKDGENMMKYLEQAVRMTVKKGTDDNNAYLTAGQYIVDHCDELLALWDGEKLPFKDKDGNDINLGGTYHLILLAEEQGKPVYLFS